MKLLSEQRANKVRFYSRAFAQRFLIPRAVSRAGLSRKLEWICDYDAKQIQERVDYYMKLDTPFVVSDDAVGMGALSPREQSAYYYDLLRIFRHFTDSVAFGVEFGDVSHLEDRPTLVKSRPVAECNGNNVLLKLNEVRHFLPISDPVPFCDKKDVLVWRGAGWQQHRKDFLRAYWNHPLCDAGQVNAAGGGVPAEWVKSKMSIAEQLRYKFILSIEGNDVATNLKWIAQSNSLCFMIRPKFETWMMEGRLVAGTHYVQLRDDYADLPEKVEHYTAHPDEALEIIENFQRYYQQFSDRRQEELISLSVVQKYLQLSGQL